jgi:hypothetical protein
MDWRGGQAPCIKNGVGDQGTLESPSAHCNSPTVCCIQGLASRSLGSVNITVTCTRRHSAGCICQPISSPCKQHGFQVQPSPKYPSAPGAGQQQQTWQSWLLHVKQLNVSIETICIAIVTLKLSLVEKGFCNARALPVLHLQWPHKDRSPTDSMCAVRPG